MIGLTKLLWMLLLLHSACARYPYMPKFYGQDSAVIVDIDKQLPHRLNPKLQNALYYNIPVYRLIQPSSSTSTTSTSTSTTTPAPEQYPSDLVYMARHKLGIKRIDELPSLGEMAELLGTGSASDTIKYIRTLTANEQGMALLKAYLESFKYAQGETDSSNEQDVPVESDDDIDGDNDDDNATDNTAIDANYDDAAQIKQPKIATTKMPETDNSFLQRIGDYLKQYDLWAHESTVAPPTAAAPPLVQFKPVFVAPVQPAPPPASMSRPLRPMMIRQPLPYHYPIPLRPIMVSQPVTPTASPSTTTEPPAPHLNSPKHKADESLSASAPVAPHVKQIAEIANIPPHVLDRFLQQQPKLAELAKRVSRLPLVQQHSRAIDSQLFAAVQRALSQDDELKRLLSSAPTLK